MTPVQKYISVSFSIGLFLLTMLSCSTVPMLKINYTVPDKTDQLRGQKVFLEIMDSRPDKDMFGDGAKEDFQNTSGSISLSVAEGHEKGFKIGLFPLTSLMQEIFKERLKSLGLDVVTDPDKRGGEPKVIIDLQTFKLDLVNKSTFERLWKASMAYKVEISHNGKMVVSDVISGESEKLKIIRKQEADSLMSDLVTDLANRLNPKDLFKQAGIN
jgi:hypothetical protein